MKTPKMLRCLFISVVCYMPTILQSQWTPLPIPMGVYISQSLCVQNGAVFTTFYDNYQIKVAKNTDLQHWSLAETLVSSSPTGLSYCFSDGSQLFVYGKNVPIGTFDAYYSENQGENWKTVYWPDQAKADLFAAWGSTFFAVNDSLVIRSTDKGENWDAGFIADSRIRALTRVSAQTWLMATDSSLYRSNDDGTGWSIVSKPYQLGGSGSQHLAVFALENGIYLECFKDTISTVYKSVDEGLTWSTFNLPFNSGYFNVRDMLFSNGRVYVCDGTVYVTEDDGQHWEALYAPNSLHLEKTNGYLCLGGSGGFFKSSDEGENWWSANLSWETVMDWNWGQFFFPKRLRYHQGKLYLFADQEFYVTENEGQEWLYHKSRTFNGLEYFFTKGDSLLVLGNGGQRSFDNGTTWQYFPENPDPEHPLSGNYLFAKNSQYVFASPVLAEKIYRSIDWGLSWVPYNPPPNLSIIQSMAGFGQSIAFTDQDDLYLSNNNGQSFSQASFGLGADPYIKNLWETDQTIFAETDAGLFARQNNAWVSADQGLNSGQGSIPEIVQLSAFQDKVLAQGVDGWGRLSLHFSGNNGQLWTGNWEDGLPSAGFAFSTALNANCMYASGIVEWPNAGLKLWKRSNIVSVNDPEAGRAVLEISPNPAQDICRIRLRNSNGWEGPNKISIFNAYGARMYDFNREQDEVVIKVSDWPQGVYFVQIIRGSGKIQQATLIVAD